MKRPPRRSWDAPIHSSCPHCLRELQTPFIMSEAGRLRAAMRTRPTGGARAGAGRPPACRGCGGRDCSYCKAHEIRRGPGRPRKGHA
jgi:hypothetical protein